MSDYFVCGNGDSRCGHKHVSLNSAVRCRERQRERQGGRISTHPLYSMVDGIETKLRLFPYIDELAEAKVTPRQATTASKKIEQMLGSLPDGGPWPSVDELIR